MLTYINCEISLPPASLDPPRGVCKAGRTTMVPKHEIYRVENTSNQSLHNVLRLHGHHAHSMVVRTLLEHLLIAGIPLLSVPLQYCSTVPLESYEYLSTQVLTVGTQILKYLWNFTHAVLLKYSNT